MNGQRLTLSIALACSTLGLLMAVLIFTDVQVMNGIYWVGQTALRTSGFPWWSERVTEQTCVYGASPGDNCAFLNYGEALAIALAASFLGSTVVIYQSDGRAEKKKGLFRALGVCLFIYGLIVAATVFIEVQVMNGVYHLGSLTLRFEGFPYGGEEVLGNGCLIGSNPYHCTLFSYDELLTLAAVGAIVGLVLFVYYSNISD